MKKKNIQTKYRTQTSQCFKTKIIMKMKSPEKSLKKKKHGKLYK